MYKLDHLPDELEKQAVQRRQRLDQERMKRIFDPKVRVLGIDVGGLEEQIKVKQELKSIDKERNELFDHAAAETNRFLGLLDRKVELARRQVAVSDDVFRAAYQQPHMRREFAHLNDPRMLRKDRSMRIGDDDETNTVSGLQKFEGEDLQQQERIRLQKEQMKKWTAEKVQEKYEQKMAEDELERQRLALNDAINHKIADLMEYENRCRRNQAESDLEFNRRLAMEKKRREQLEKEIETAINQREIDGNVNGAFLTEAPAPDQPGPHKIRIDAFKGMRPQQIQDILQTRARQRLEAKQKETQERMEEKQWATQTFWNNRAATLLERERERLKKERQALLLQENQLLAQTFKQKYVLPLMSCKNVDTWLTVCDWSRQSHLDKVVYTNPVHNEYFMQFNTTSR
ncbi:hypothetical protein RI367_006310 [Sorochytrium milnesiophthora]